MPLRHAVPLCHLQADWLTPFDFAAHSYSGREMKRTAAAVTRDERTPPSDPLAKKAIVEPEEALSLSLMIHDSVVHGKIVLCHRVLYGN